MPRYLHIENAPNGQVTRARGRLRRVFFRYVWLAAFVHLAAIALVGFYIAFWWRAGYVWILYLRFPTAVRAALLAATPCVGAEVLRLHGVGRYYKILRQFSRHPTLGPWLLIGFVDLYLIRYPIVLWNILRFVLRDAAVTAQFGAYLALDLLFVAEFYVTLGLVYYLGIRRNVRENLLRKATARGAAV